MKRRAAPILALLLLASCKTIPTIPDLPQRDLVTLGDSVTMGVGAGGEGADPACFDAWKGDPTAALGGCDPREWIDRGQAYPYLVTKALGVKHANLAVAGAMSDDVARWQVIPAMALRPRYVTLFVGGNDLVHGRTPEAYAADLSFVLGRLGEDPEDPDVKLFVLNLPDVWRAPRFQAKPDRDVTPERVAAFNAATKAAVAQYKATLVDISGPELTAPELFSTDGFHWNGLAHQRLATEVLAAINAR